MTDPRPLNVGARLLLTGVVVATVMAPVVARVSATRGQPEAEVEGPWTPHMRALDDALETHDLIGAVGAWYRLHATALENRSWEGLLITGQAALRLAELPSISRAFTTKARQAYLSALFRARDERSVDGVLRAAWAFAELGDREVVDGALRIAGQVAAQTGHGAGERVQAAAQLLEVRLASPAP
jgi:hypothetical protein